MYSTACVVYVHMYHMCGCMYSKCVCACTVCVGVQYVEYMWLMYSIACVVYVRTYSMCGCMSCTVGLHILCTVQYILADA